MQLLQMEAEVHCWHPVEHEVHWPAELMKFLLPQMHLLSTVLVNEAKQVVHVFASTHVVQYGVQAAQYLTPSEETVKNVWLGQLHCPLVDGVASETQLGQLVAEEHVLHPGGQGTQLFLSSA